MTDEDELYGLHCDIGRLEVENTKLRKLVRDMYHVIATLEEANDEAVVRDGVMLDAEYFAKHMRELGMEVKENDVSAGLRVEDAERTQRGRTHPGRARAADRTDS